MKVGQNAIKLIQYYEDCKLIGYYCPAKIPTIGWGSTVIDGRKVVIGEKITQEKADALLMNEVNFCFSFIMKSVKVELSQNQLDAIISFVYNVGSGAFQKSTLLRELNKGNYEEVPNQLIRWIKGGEKDEILLGLIIRRQSECDLWERNKLIFYVKGNV